MFSPEDQQIEICLLKSNLEKIGDDLLFQFSALPAIDAENEQKQGETMAALRVARSLNAEKERLDMENVKLTAIRTQLKRQCEDITKELARARKNRDQLTDLMNSAKREIEQQIRNYEVLLREKADRLRETSAFYNEEVMGLEIEKVKNAINKLEGELGKSEKDVDDLIYQLNDLKSCLPEDLLNMVGKVKLDEKLNEVVMKFEALCDRQHQLLQKQP